MFPHLFTKESVEPFKCDTCQFSKHHRATFSPSNNKSLEPFDLIHSYVWEPASNSISGAKWFVSFIDDCTHVTWIFLMKHKYEVCQIFVDFFRLVKNQFNKSIKRLRSDNGTEFVNLEFSKFLKDNGVVHKLTCVNTPQQNGVAERKIVTSLKLLEPSSSKCLFLMYIGEKLPTRVLNGISPIKHMLSFFPSSPLMLSLPSHVFGCVAFVHSHNPHCGKLDPKAVKCVFIGYPSNKKGFKCYHPPSRRLFVSMDDVQVQVQEVMPTQDVQVQEVTKPTLVLEQLQMSELDVSIPDNSIEEQVQLFESEVSIPDNSIEDVTDDMPIALRKGKRSCVKYPISQFMRISHLFVQHQSFITAIDAIKTPTLTYGIDYEETFAPIAKMNTVRVIISLAAHFGWNLQQFDVKNAFLHGELEEEVYMEIPPGFYSHNEKNKVCKLKKALYGLKQSPRTWFGRFAQVMISLGYRQSQGDHTLFIKHSPNGKLTLLLVYVDDMIVT
ncbi:hypothetical protein CR513_60537, partial [Mucuna pruriens]